MNIVFFCFFFANKMIAFSFMKSYQFLEVESDLDRGVFCFIVLVSNLFL